MKSKLIAMLICISSLAYSYTQDLVKSMVLFWKIYDDQGPEDALEYLDYLIDTEYTPDVDKLHYLYHRRFYYYHIDDAANIIKTQMLIESLCKYDPECQEEREKYWENP